MGGYLDPLHGRGLLSLGSVLGPASEAILFSMGAMLLFVLARLSCGGMPSPPPAIVVVLLAPGRRRGRRVGVARAGP